MIKGYTRKRKVKKKGGIFFLQEKSKIAKKKIMGMIIFNIILLKYYNLFFLNFLNNKNLNNKI
jgi:hypothetical protein